MEAIPQKDIAIAVLGASLALASVLVVFIGFLITRVQALPATTPNKIQERYTRAARWGLAPLVGAVMVTVASYAWMILPGCPVFFWGWAVGFPLVVIGFMAYAIAAVMIH